MLAMQLAGLALLLASAAWVRRTRPWWTFAILWLFLQLAPSNTLIARWDIANERHLYLAGIGVFIASGIEAERPRRIVPRAGALALVAAAVLVLGAFTVLRNLDYRTEIALWEDAARKSPHKARVHNNLGDAYARAGDRDRARSSFLKALEVDPDYLRARLNLRALDAGVLVWPPATGNQQAPGVATASRKRRRLP
jgi:tetratricopeptide (TPR) repeat protein